MASSKPEPRLIKAAGAVAWRPGPDGRPEILLVHRRKYDDWSLPKGKVEPGETRPVTAGREVLEEGGARVAGGARPRARAGPRLHLDPLHRRRPTEAGALLVGVGRLDRRPRRPQRR